MYIKIIEKVEMILFSNGNIGVGYFTDNRLKKLINRKNGHKKKQ